MPHYLVYSRSNRQFHYFQPIADRYQEQPLCTGNPLVWLDDLEIGLGIWEGMFNDVPGCWLRWCDRRGDWYLTDTEQERLAKEQSQIQLLQAGRNLLATGMELEQVAGLLNLSEEQVQRLNDDRF